jgi:IS1 family transposase
MLLLYHISLSFATKIRHHGADFVRSLTDYVRPCSSGSLKSRATTCENTYIMTMVSRLPRQIVGFDVAFDKSPKRIQAIVDNAPKAENYCTDGWLGYVDVVYPGRYIRNVCNKNDTYTVEGVNADLRHYIPILRRRSRCFPRSLETLKAVIEVFVDAYNAFGVAKMRFRQNRDPNSRELPFSVVDFL